jgi:hypothetical protein
VISHPTPDVRLDPDDRAREGPHLWKPEAPPPSYPSPVPTTPGSPPWFFAPGGAFAPGLRAPFDLPPEEIRRRQVLEATQFDTDWGEPPSGDGLQWSTTKLAYEPTKDDAGSPYRYPAQYGMHQQAFQGGSVPIGRWGVRWVDTTRTPYRILPASERHVWDLHVQSAQRYGSEKGSRGGLVDKRTVTPPTRDFPLLDDHSVDIVLPPGYGPPPKKFNLGDYAWIAQRDLPMGCPYPYPYLPVPQEDYASGRWLAPDYVPSISLPPPYDQTPWQCGATPQAVERKKGKQGEAYRNLLGDITDADAIAASEAARAAEAEAARKAAEGANKAGIPTATGTAAPDEVGSQSSKVAKIEKDAMALAERIARSSDTGQADKDKAELAKLQKKLGAEKEWLKHLRIVKENQEIGEEGYANPAPPAVPPSLVLRGGPPIPQPPGGGAPPPGGEPPAQAVLRPPVRRVRVYYPLSQSKDPATMAKENAANAKEAVDKFLKEHADDGKSKDGKEASEFEQKLALGTSHALADALAAIGNPHQDASPAELAAGATAAAKTNAVWFTTQSFDATTGDFSIEIHYLDVQLLPEGGPGADIAKHERGHESDFQKINDRSKHKFERKRASVAEQNAAIQEARDEISKNLAAVAAASTEFHRVFGTSGYRRPRGPGPGGR